MSVPKADYDELALPEMKEHYAKDHYAYAVKFLVGAIADWRKQYGITEPMRFIFDQVQKGKGGKGEIMNIWDTLELLPEAEKIWGLAKGGYSFEDKAVFKPLQAADALAWHMYDHMTNVVLKNPPRQTRPSFKCLRKDRPMTLGFLGRANLEENAREMKEYERTTGKSPMMIVEAQRQRTILEAGKNRTDQKRNLAG